MVKAQVCHGDSAEREKKQQNFRENRFQIQTSHVSSFLEKEKQIYPSLGQKKGCLQAFPTQLFLDETIIVKLYIKKIILKLSK